MIAKRKTPTRRLMQQRARELLLREAGKKILFSVHFIAIKFRTNLQTYPNIGNV